MLARLAATLHPERVLSVVSCGSAASKLGSMMAAFSAGAEEFYDKMKAAELYGEDGKPPWGSRRATRDAVYVMAKARAFADAPAGLLAPTFFISTALGR